MADIFPLNLTINTDKLKELIAEHPDYPIVVLADDTANSGEWVWQYCYSIGFSVEEILDCLVPYENDDFVETDRTNFEERMEEWLWDNWKEQTGSDEKEPPEDIFQKELANLIADFDPYWKKVIAIYVGN